MHADIASIFHIFLYDLKLGMPRSMLRNVLVPIVLSICRLPRNYPRASFKGSLIALEIIPIFSLPAKGHIHLPPLFHFLVVLVWVLPSLRCEFMPGYRTQWKILGSLGPVVV